MANHTISKDILGLYLPKNPVIVEAGAHIGRDTLKMLKAWPNATIHAFEPIPELFETLKAKTASFHSIHCYPLALSNNSGKQTFFKSSGRSTATSSLYEPDEYKKTHPDTIFSPLTVSTIRLDEWAQQHNICHIDGLWLDMQGGELNALKGAGALLSTIHMIYTEVNLIERYKGIPLYPEIKQWLEERGFELKAEAFSPHQWGNALFVNKRFSH